MWRANALQKTLMLGKIEGKGEGGCRGWNRWLDSTTDSIDRNLTKFQEIVKDREDWCAAVHGVTKSWLLLGDWTTTIWPLTFMLKHFKMLHCLDWKISSSIILIFCKEVPIYPNREGHGIPLQYSCLENPMDGGAWWAAVHGVAKSWTLSDFTVTFHFHALEKEMATHSSVLAWRIPGMGEPGGLQSMELHRVGHDWSNLAAAAAYTPKWNSELRLINICPL